ncbi:MAG: hypothetical protein NZ529_02645 [Cytophagaceae bacterium]|nr:hypothetical protein [Cytophagaceae bacterium]MDW8455669.1 hypothetical protein [Cytophagaceae bacterium]
MSFWKKIFGYSQREIWTIASKEVGGEIVYGKALEADSIILNYRGFDLRMYVTTKGRSWYTILETMYEHPEYFSIDKETEKELKKRKIKFLVSKAEEGGYRYLLENKEEGLDKDLKSIKKRFENFKYVIDFLQVRGLKIPQVSGLS